MLSFRYYCTMIKDEAGDNFFVVRYEVGAEKTLLPTWASQRENPLNLNLDYSKTLQRVEIKSVPGAFQLLDLFSKEECAAFPFGDHDDYVDSITQALMRYR